MGCRVRIGPVTDHIVCRRCLEIYFLDIGNNEGRRLIFKFVIPTIALLSNIPFPLNTTHHQPSQPIILTVTYATRTHNLQTSMRHPQPQIINDNVSSFIRADVLKDSTAICTVEQ
jgi:hypothetical protein